MKHLGDKKEKICVLQLSRLGDILMSLPLIEALSKKHGGADIYFVVNAMFKDLLPESSYFKLIPVDFNWLSYAFRRAETADDAVAILEGSLGAFLAIEFDLVVNLSGLKVAAILASLLQGRDKRGMLFSKDESLVHSDPHLALFTKNKTGRKVNWLHQVEIFLSVLKGGRPASLHQSGDYLFGSRFKTFLGAKRVPGRYVLICPGASIPEKEIGKETLVAMVQSLLDHTAYKIVLCGRENDGGAKAFLPNDSERVTDLFGRTDLPGLFNLVFHADCVISNDSGPMHMAALLNKRNVVVSTGAAFFPETTGYSPGVMVLTPREGCYPCPWIGFPCSMDFACKRRFDPDHVSAWLLRYIGGKESPEFGKALGVYETKVGSEGLFFVPVGEKGLDPTELLGLVYQAFWKEKLFDFDGQEIFAYAVSHYRVMEKDLAVPVSSFRTALEGLYPFMEHMLSCFPTFRKTGRPQVMDQINSGVEKIFQWSEQDTFLAPLFHYHGVLFHSLHSDDFDALFSAYRKNMVELLDNLKRLDQLLAFFQSRFLSNIGYVKHEGRLFTRGAML